MHTAGQTHRRPRRKLRLRKSIGRPFAWSTPLYALWCYLGSNPGSRQHEPDGARRAPCRHGLRSGCLTAAMLDAYVAAFQAHWGRTWYIQWLDLPASTLRGWVTVVHRRTGCTYTFDLDHEEDGYHLIGGGPDDNGWAAVGAWWLASERARQRALAALLSLPELSSTASLSPGVRAAIEAGRRALAGSGV